MDYVTDFCVGILTLIVLVLLVLSFMNTPPHKQSTHLKMAPKLKEVSKSNTFH